MSAQILIFGVCLEDLYSYALELKTRDVKFNAIITSLNSVKSKECRWEFY